MPGISIDKAEVLRYLGHRGQSYGAALSDTIDACITECEGLARPLHVFRFFDLAHEPGGLRLAGTQVCLTGTAIAAHLAGAERCVLLAVTLGTCVESRIRQLEYTDLTAAAILDAAATDAVEKACDAACAEITQRAAQEGLYTGARFSPGYGDLPLTLQPGILAVLNAGRAIGLTCTESLILLPRKSVTAVMGLFAGPQTQERPGCAECSLRGSCSFRRCGRAEGAQQQSL